MDGFLCDAFFFSKSAIALMAWYMDARVMAYYLLMYLCTNGIVDVPYHPHTHAIRIFRSLVLLHPRPALAAASPPPASPPPPPPTAVVALLFPQPLFQGPAKMEYFTPASFADLVEDRQEGDVAWLVEFFAPWAPQCLFLEPVIAELSLTYGTPSLRFGKVDVSRWPAMAGKYNVSVTGVSNQLPTLVMFEMGKETGRIPHVAKDGTVASGKFRRGDIVTAFALGERAEKAAERAAGAATGKGKGGGSGGKKKR